MKITIESTTTTTTINGVPARIWEGETESGVPCLAFITRIAAAKDVDRSQFEAELVECREPTNPDLKIWPNRMIL